MSGETGVQVPGGAVRVRVLPCHPATSPELSVDDRQHDPTTGAGARGGAVMDAELVLTLLIFALVWAD